MLKFTIALLFAQVLLAAPLPTGDANNQSIQASASQPVLTKRDTGIGINLHLLKLS